MGFSRKTAKSMKVTEKQLNLIHNYLSQSLSPNEQSIFDKSLESLDFREELMSQARLIDSLTEVDNIIIREKMELLPDSSVDVNKEKTTKKVVPPASLPSSRRWFWLTGALVLFSAALWFMLTQNKQSTSNSMIQMAQAYDTPLPPGHIKRGATEPTTISEAIQAYANKDYEKALALFQSNSSLNTSDKLYISNCLIQLGRYEEAKSTLVDINLPEGDKLQDDVDWYLSIAALGLEDKANAERLLNKISKDVDNVYKANAQKLLQEL